MLPMIEHFKGSRKPLKELIGVVRSERLKGLKPQIYISTVNVEKGLKVWLEPSKTLNDFIEANMLYGTEDLGKYYLNLVHMENGTVRIFICYDPIIGSRFLKSTTWSKCHEWLTAE